jgi:DnaJ family protein B protein 13
MLTPSEYAQEQLMREQAEQLESLQVFMFTAEAFDVLFDPLRKAIYDQFGEKALKEGLPGPDGFISPYAFHGDPFRTFRLIICIFIHVL